MSTPTFAKTHNLIAYLEKPTESEGFVQIIDFPNGSSIKYALTVNDEVRIQALVDGKMVNIKESLIRRILRLDDAEGTYCLTNTEIFEGLAKLGEPEKNRENDVSIKNRKRVVSKNRQSALVRNERCGEIKNKKRVVCKNRLSDLLKVDVVALKLTTSRVYAAEVKYAFTLSPTIYTSCIKQFWTSAKVKIVNDEVKIQALVDGKRVNIKESFIRRTPRLDDTEGLAKIGYEKPSDKLTFYKAFLSPQWKFVIHTILQCLSAKTTSWNEFSSTMASAIICLATNQKFNFSRYILLSLVKNIEAGIPFFMFSREVTSLFDNMLVQAHEEVDDAAEPVMEKEKSSKHGRKIEDIDADVEINLEKA
nr:hypothetical protein [Tanacetum cinerariifolium]